MGFNLDVLNRILVGAKSVVDQLKGSTEREKAKDAVIADLQTQLGQRDQELAADAQVNEAANKAALETADALDALLKGSETPETPVVPAPEDVPAVVSGDAPVEGGETDVDGVDAPTNE